MKKIGIILFSLCITMLSCDTDSVYETEQESELMNRNRETGLQVPIGKGGGSGGSLGCPSDNYAVTGDCNSGAFNGIVSDNCIPFDVNGQYNAGTITNLQVSISDSDYNVTNVTYYYISNSSGSNYNINVSYTWTEVTQTETDNGGYTLTVLTHNASEVLHLYPCTSTFN